jgi:hypothetical protein
MKIAGLRCHAWALAGATLAGCAAAQAPNQVPSLVPQTTNGNSHESASHVYVAECCHFASSGGNITLYGPALAGVARTITKGVGEADFITVDRSGRLSAINRFYSGTVTEWDRGSLSPSRPFSIEGRMGRSNR